MTDLSHGGFKSSIASDLYDAVPSVSRLSPQQAADAERDYTAYRAAVINMLRREFPRMHGEHEEVYQQAWTEFLELRVEGVAIDNPRALLQKIAWRAARARVRRKKPDLVDPQSATLAAAVDAAPLPDEAAQVHVDAEALRAVVESLDARQAAAIKLRFDFGMSAKEIQQRLGVSAKRLEKIVTEAYAQLAAQLDLDDQGDSAWLRRQRSLLLACEAGLASDRQRRRARRVLEAHPRCRAMLAEMRSSLEELAVLLPPPILAEPERVEPAVHGIADRVGDLLGSARHVPYEAVQKGLPIPNAAEQTGGIVGAAVTAGTAAKVAALCLAAGGSVALCIETLKLPEPEPRPRVERPAAKRVVEPDRTAMRVVRAPVQRQPTRETRRRTPEPPVSSPSAKPPASPAPPGSTEFGPGVLGSTEAPTQPAAAPADGGGEFTP